MAGINYGRVALGALAGGIVANACDFVINAILFVEDNERMVQRLNLNPAQVEGRNLVVHLDCEDAPAQAAAS